MFKSAATITEEDDIEVINIAKGPFGLEVICSFAEVISIVDDKVASEKPKVANVPKLSSGTRVMKDNQSPKAPLLTPVRPQDLPKINKKIAAPEAKKRSVFEAFGEEVDKRPSAIKRRKAFEAGKDLSIAIENAVAAATENVKEVEVISDSAKKVFNDLIKALGSAVLEFQANSEA